jgi:hypothetical protein
MAMGRPKAKLGLTAGQREQLESLANSRSLPAGLVMRARHSAERDGKNQSADRPPAEAHPCHGGQVATAVFGTGCSWAARRIAPGTSAADRR